MTLLPHTEPGDWICEACNGPLVPIGVLGTREHARCRSCGLDHNRTAQEPDEGSDEPDADLDFQDAILTRPGDDIIETVQAARDKPRS